jgi:hypothetical protein
MKKIGILTFHLAHNYGAVLQSYALQNVLSKEEYEVNIINYYNKRIYSRYKVICPIRKNLIKYLKIIIKDIPYYKMKSKRYSAFNSFINKNLKLTKKYNSKKMLEKSNLKYDVIIAGSDQIWNKNIVGELSDIYTLNFRCSAKKISYAASIGDISQIKKNKNEYKSKLKNISALSVRESDAQQELEKTLKKDIKCVLDPTLLLSKDEWNEYIKQAKNKNIKQRYILAYVVEPDEEYVKIVNYLSEKTGLGIIHFDKKNPGFKNIIKSSFEEGPLEFVNYIKNAEYVVATSFHATVFSIIYNKNFFIIPHRKTGARVVDLVNKLGVEDRIYYDIDSFQKTDYNKKIQWDKIEKKLKEEREISKKWLINSIENGE